MGRVSFLSHKQENEKKYELQAVEDYGQIIASFGDLSHAVKTTADLPKVFPLCNVKVLKLNFNWIYRMKTIEAKEALAKYEELLKTIRIIK